MAPFDPARDADQWPDRERQWRKALGRIRIGVEPIPEQLERMRLVAWTLTAVAGGIGLMFVALFSAFGHPIIGLVVASVLVGPVIASAWAGFLRTRGRVDRYLREKEEVSRPRAASVPSSSIDGEA